MISNNALANRLNAFKNGEPIPKQPVQESLLESAKESNMIVTLVSSGINFLYAILRSLSYGFAIKTIFAADWKFLGWLAIGFAIETLTIEIFTIFTKK